MDSTTATAAKVEAARESKGVSRLALAEQTGIPRTTLNRKLDGKQPFTVPDIQAIADVLEVAPTAIVSFRAVA